METAEKEERGSCSVRLLTLISMLLLLGLLMFAPGYVTAEDLQSRYTNATCIIAPGRVIFDRCRVGGFGCNKCYQDCWRAYSAISAVPGVSIYLYRGAFFSEGSADNFANQNVGRAIGPCYYTNGGRSIRYSLPDPYGFVIAGIVFFGLALILMIWGIILSCKISPLAIAMRASCRRGLERCLTGMLRVCSCRRQGYTDIDRPESNVGLDVL